MPQKSPRRRVLFIEDERSLRTSYSRYFAARYEMAFAESGQEALERLDTFHPDVIVLDLRLPDTDGIDLFQVIRRRLPGVPVVVTTAYHSMEPLMQVLNLGHSGYLVKPFELAELATLIDATG